MRDRQATSLRSVRTACALENTQHRETRGLRARHEP